MPATLLFARTAEPGREVGPVWGGGAGGGGGGGRGSNAAVEPGAEEAEESTAGEEAPASCGVRPGQALTSGWASRKGSVIALVREPSPSAKAGGSVPGQGTQESTSECIHESKWNNRSMFLSLPPSLSQKKFN